MVNLTTLRRRSSSLIFSRLIQHFKQIHPAPQVMCPLHSMRFTSIYQSNESSKENPRLLADTHHTMPTVGVAMVYFASLEAGVLLAPNCARSNSHVYRMNNADGISFSLIIALTCLCIHVLEHSTHSIAA